jgi:geranylgeranyl diphosphate synthase type I
MVLSSTIQTTLSRYQQEIHSVLRSAIDARIASHTDDDAPFYGQMQYHLGWVDANLTPATGNPGKLLRPTLVLLAYEAAGAWGLAGNTIPVSDYLQRALPAAAAVELTHNFTLIHDDIEDGDTERRHRPTLWSVWGIPQAINTGDGMFALARLTLWGVLERGVDGNIAAHLGRILDHACLVLAEGQYLDISFEKRQDISVAMYVDMISRKTGALLGCAAEMGARIGTRDEQTIKRLRHFGEAMGVAFQIRDDLLGVWASSAASGKTEAGDIYRRKKSLPVLHALEHASPQDRAFLNDMYQQETAVTEEQVKHVLAVMERTETRAYCSQFLLKQCQIAFEALSSIPRVGKVSERAIEDMETLVHFVEVATH